MFYMFLKVDLYQLLPGTVHAWWRRQTSKQRFSRPRQQESSLHSLGGQKPALTGISLPSLQEVEVF